MNYQEELAKVKPSHLKLIHDTIRNAGISKEMGGDWRSVFNKEIKNAISPRVKALLRAFSNVDDIDHVLASFMSVTGNVE